MPDSLLNHTPLINSEMSKSDSFSGKVWSELNLLSTGINDGFKSRAQQAYENKEMTVLEFGASTMVAAGLAAMRSGGGRLAAIANVANYSLMAGLGVDVTRRAVPSAQALLDNWSNPQNFEANKNVIATKLGTAAFDYPLIAAGGFLGHSASGRAIESYRSMQREQSMEFAHNAVADFYAKRLGASASIDILRSPESAYSNGSWDPGSKTMQFGNGDRAEVYPLFNFEKAPRN